jgi:hypothetical protein
VQALEDGRELHVDLRGDGVRDLPLRGVVLEVDRPLRQAVEPAAERVPAEVAESEHVSEPEHGNGLEVLAHELRLAASRELVEQPADERLDQVGRRRLDDARAERRIEHVPEPLLPLSVD